MNSMVAYTGDAVFDGESMHWGKSLVLHNGNVEGIVENNRVPANCFVKPFPGQIISPGFVDLQVNGGDGLLLSHDPSLETIKRMSAAHIKTGTAAFLPTLTTDTPEYVDLAIATVSKAIENHVPGVLGLHLEGPHLAVCKKGAHDADLIRPMGEKDLEVLCAAAALLPTLMVTVAVESVSPAQIEKLCSAGAIVSLGHTNGDYEACMAAVNAGASCATHLFNAMSQTCGRSPGLVGTVLSCQNLATGIIADGHHVHPANVALAFQAKASNKGLFLVSDAMALTGSRATNFEFGGRTVQSCGGRLVLEDGTLAGADIDLAQSVQNLMEFSDANLEQALSCATSVPAVAIKRSNDVGSFICGRPAHAVICFDAKNVGSVTSANVFSN